VDAPLHARATWAKLTSPRFFVAQHQVAGAQRAQQNSRQARAFLAGGAGNAARRGYAADAGQSKPTAWAPGNRADPAAGCIHCRSGGQATAGPGRKLMGPPAARAARATGMAPAPPRRGSDRWRWAVVRWVAVISRPQQRPGQSRALAAQRAWARRTAPPRARRPRSTKRAQQIAAGKGGGQAGPSLRARARRGDVAARVVDQRGGHCCSRSCA